MPFKTLFAFFVGNSNIVKLCYIGIFEINLNFGFGLDGDVNIISDPNVGLCRTCLCRQSHILCSNRDVTGNEPLTGVILSLFTVPLCNAKIVRQLNLDAERGIVILFKGNRELCKGHFLCSINDFYGKARSCGESVDGVECNGVTVDAPLCSERDSFTFAINFPSLILGNQVAVFVSIKISAVAPIITHKGVTLFGGGCKI